MRIWSTYYIRQSYQEIPISYYIFAKLYITHSGITNTEISFVLCVTFSVVQYFIYLNIQVIYTKIKYNKLRVYNIYMHYIIWYVIYGKLFLQKHYTGCTPSIHSIQLSLLILNLVVCNHLLYGVQSYTVQQHKTVNIR